MGIVNPVVDALLAPSQCALGCAERGRDGSGLHMLGDGVHMNTEELSELSSCIEKFHFLLCQNF